MKNWQKRHTAGGMLDLREHRWRVLNDEGVVAHFSNEGAALATAGFLGSPIGNGGTGAAHWTAGPQHRHVLGGERVQ